MCLDIWNRDLDNLDPYLWSGNSDWLAPQNEDSHFSKHLSFLLSLKSPVIHLSHCLPLPSLLLSSPISAPTPPLSLPPSSLPLNLEKKSDGLLPPRIWLLINLHYWSCKAVMGPRLSLCSEASARASVDFYSIASVYNCGAGGAFPF